MADNDDIDSLELWQLKGEITELKSDKLDEKAVNECYYNMYGGATKLMTIHLGQGKIITKAVMFGIVCNIKHPQKCTLLKIIINSDTQECQFSG